MAAPIKTRGIAGGLRGASLAYRIGIGNLVTGLAGVLIALSFGAMNSLGFAAGFALGLINVFWLMRIAKKGVLLEAARAGRLVARSYYLRFAATALVLALLISRSIVSPLPLLAGLSSAIFTTLGVMIFSAFEEVR